MKTFYVIKDFEELKKDTIVKMTQEKALPLKIIKVLIPFEIAFKQCIIKTVEEIPKKITTKKNKKRRIKWQ